MTPRKFVARNAREAMDQVREAIGPDAVILANRKVDGGVEITALDESELARWEAQTPPAGDGERSSAASAQPQRSSRATAPAGEPMSTVSFQQFVNDRQRRLREQDEVLVSAATAAGDGGAPDALRGPADDLGAEPVEPSSPRTSALQAGATIASEAVASAPGEGIEAVIRRRMPPASSPGEAPRPPASPPEVASAGTREIATHADMALVVAELRQMRSFISQQFGALSWVDGVRRTPAQARLLREMLAACFSPRLARAMIGSLPRESSDEQADQWLRDALVRNLGVACFEDGQLEQGGVFALVGPTGVGKTTSAAKIAAQCALRHGAHQVGLIGIDTYRVAAQDQLRRYGDIIGIDVHTVRDGRALLDTLSRMSDKHLVLIDTIGLGQRDPRIERMLDSLTVSAVRRLIVVSAAAQPEAIDETLAAYRAEQADGALLTKIDEACRLGGALDALIRYRVPLMAVGCGQRVPEDWQRPDPSALVEQALRVPQTRHQGLSDIDLALLMQRIDLDERPGTRVVDGALHV
ncbi:MAG: flagellar biosynthesis protein FlhF [Burkholderiaceae bacterium]